MFGWLIAFQYLSQLVGIILAAKALYPGRRIQTLVVVCNPGMPLTPQEAENRLAGTGATVLPGFTFTP